MLLVLVPPPSPRRRLPPPLAAALLVLATMLPTVEAVLPPFSTSRILLGAALLDIASSLIPWSRFRQRALSVNALQPTNPLAHAMSGTTLVNLACVHDVAQRACEVVSRGAHTFSVALRVPSAILTVSAAGTVYIDSNDTDLLPIRCSTVDSMFLGTRSLGSPLTSPSTNALDCEDRPTHPSCTRPRDLTDAPILQAGKELMDVPRDPTDAPILSRARPKDFPMHLSCERAREPTEAPILRAASGADQSTHPARGLGS
ncbi:hypothetical protein B0H11DRAFT_2247282 [Mycena galericulata]|nr:hypothetical protein B0H11DRAFT_2247282 [Mycena galericulata]